MRQTRQAGGRVAVAVSGGKVARQGDRVRVAAEGHPEHGRTGRVRDATDFGGHVAVRIAPDRGAGPVWADAAALELAPRGRQRRRLR